MKNKYCRNILIIGTIILTTALKMLGQNSIGIGIANPNPNAILDINHGSKGLLLPRIALTNLNLPSPLGSFVEGMIVFNTATTGSLTPGYYITKGGAWQRVQDDVLVWKLQGNDNTTAANNFIGTTDAQDLVLRMNNERAGLINPNNTSLGYLALKPTTTGQFTTAVGVNSLFDNAGGNNNTAFGYQSLYSNNGGNNNVGIGSSALISNTIGNNNVAVGYEAGYFSTGSGNVFLGNKAGHFPTGNDKLYIHNNASNDAGALVYGEFDTDKVRVNNMLGIGKLPSSSALEIRAVSTANELISFHNHLHQELWYLNLFSDGSLNFGETATGDERMVLGLGGKLGIGRRPTSHALEIKARGSTNELLKLFGNADDERWHLNIKPNGSLNFVETGIADHRLVLAQNGYVGVGKPNPSADFHIQETNEEHTPILLDLIPGGFNDWNSNGGLKITTFSFDDLDFKSVNLVVDNGNDLNFNFQGKAQSYLSNDGNYVTFSDRRFKENIRPIPNVLSKIQSLNAKSYTFKHNKTTPKLSHGFIAQEVETVFPEIVHTNGASHSKSIGYDNFNVLAVQAIKEQQDVINGLSNTIYTKSKNLEDQNKEIDSLKLKLEQLLIRITDK